MEKILFIDTETSDMLKGFPDSRPSLYQPWICQIAMILSDGQFDYHVSSHLINSIGRPISPSAQAIHKISNEMTATGLSEKSIANLIIKLSGLADIHCCHNIGFDIPMTRLLLIRQGFQMASDELGKKKTVCTMEDSTNYCKLPKKRGVGYKWPKLEELHEILFGEPLVGAHNALVDVMATKRCYFELKNRGVL